MCIFICELNLHISEHRVKFRFNHCLKLTSWKYKLIISKNISIIIPYHEANQ